MLSIYPEFQMKVFGSGTSGSACQPYCITGLHDISGFYQVPGIMTINTFQSIIMTHNNYISISSVCFAIRTIPSNAQRIVSLALVFISVPLCPRRAPYAEITLPPGRGKQYSFSFILSR